MLPSLVTGGTERGCVDIAAAVARAGGTSVVASSGGPMVHALARGGVVHALLPLASKNPFVMRANIDRLTELIVEHEVDLVHARSRAPAWSALIAARRMRRPFVTTFHGTYAASNPVKRWYNSVMTRGERVIAISQFVADHIRDNYRVDMERVRVIHRGIDLVGFDPGRVSAERIVKLASRWRLPDGMPVVILPGRLTRWKGQTVLIDAIAQMASRNFHCLLIGSDQGRSGYRQELQRHIDRRGVTEVVHIVDHCDDMPVAYMLADAVVSASTEPEAFGRVVVEAQAMGRPVIASDHGGPRETVRHGETGWLTPPGDATALAATLERVLALSPEERASLAEAAMAHVRRAYSIDEMCTRTLALYDEVLGAAPTRAAAVV